eukprot:s285_g4.t1
MGEAAKEVIFGRVRRVETLFRVAGVALRDIPTCFKTFDLQSLPYLSKWQEEDKYDGELEDCKKDPQKRREFVPVREAFVDFHLKEHTEKQAAGGDVPAVSARKLPLTGLIWAARWMYLQKARSVAGYAQCNTILVKAGMVTHRGNLNYQDCRRVLIDGYAEDGPNFLDDKARWW